MITVEPMVSNMSHAAKREVYEAVLAEVQRMGITPFDLYCYAVILDARIERDEYNANDSAAPRWPAQGEADLRGTLEANYDGDFAADSFMEEHGACVNMAEELFPEEMVRKPDPIETATTFKAVESSDEPGYTMVHVVHTGDYDPMTYHGINVLIWDDGRIEMNVADEEAQREINIQQNRFTILKEAMYWIESFAR